MITPVMPPGCYRAPTLRLTRHMLSLNPSRRLVDTADMLREQSMKNFKDILLRVIWNRQPGEERYT